MAKATKPTPPAPTDQQQSATAAAASATAAGTSATAADTAATAAETAATGRVATQTAPSSAESAMAARTAATAAGTEKTKADAAAAAAAAATNARDAAKAELDAAAAATAAASAATTAGTERTAAEARAGKEVHVSGTSYSVGDTSADTTDGALTVTVNGESTITGRMKSMDPMQNIGAVVGVTFVANTDPVADVEYVQAVAARNLMIGTTLDSTDDMARLMLITKYAGTKKVKVYAEMGTADTSSTKAGKISAAVGSDNTLGTADDTYVSLKAKGMYYLAGTAGQSQDGLSDTDVIGAQTKADQVYSYTWYGDDGEPGGTGSNADVTRYVVLETTATSGEVTTRTYQHVDITALASDDTTDGAAEEVGVMATIPDPSSYKHISFGVWAGLGTAAKDGSQKLSDLGIGFVDGSGMTADMPNFGDATYDGNWVAAVRSADEDGDGDINLAHGVATLKADFTKDEVTATLTGLAMLEGAISGSGFSGTKATVTHNELDTSDPKNFTGSFSGGFYGTKAAEAGGVFDFTSEDMKAGEFRGAFGGGRSD